MKGALFGIALTALAAPAVAQIKSIEELLNPIPSEQCDAQTRHAIIVHGGTSPGELRPARTDFIRAMLADRRAELEAGDSALDVAERAVLAMEDSGLFNAGKGAISNHGGFVETDASIMDGRTQDAGAVASLTGIKNPIRAARTVMEATSHVMFVGDRGEAKLREMGLDTVTPDYFSNNARSPDDHGTVGAAVLDRCGDLAAGTSTGGYDNKTPGRVGDSPVVGAGVFAKNGVMAGSATGHGEFFIRFGALRSVAARMEWGGQAMEDAARAVLEEMDAAGPGRAGRGALVLLDGDGNPLAIHQKSGLVFGLARDDTEPLSEEWPGVKD